MRCLAVSDIHCDLDAARRVVDEAVGADVVLAAGDFANQHRGLEDVIDVLRAIETPTVLVPGNNERPEDLRRACERWGSAQVLHGEVAQGLRIEGRHVFGLGAGVPVTPFGSWSFDLTEDEARDLLTECPEGALIVSHSPPKGHADATSAGEHVGSEALLEAIEAKRPPLVVCGHVHDAWEVESVVSETRIINVGPRCRMLEMD